MFFARRGGGGDDLIDEFLVARLGFFSYLFFCFYFMKQTHKLETDPRYFSFIPPDVWLSAWESHSYAQDG